MALASAGASINGVEIQGNTLSGPGNAIFRPYVAREIMKIVDGKLDQLLKDGEAMAQGDTSSFKTYPYHHSTEKETMLGAIGLALSDKKPIMFEKNGKKYCVTPEIAEQFWQNAVQNSGLLEMQKEGQ